MTQIAAAADLPMKTPTPAPVAAPVYNWTGFYLGLNGGYGWANGNVTASPFGATAIADMTAHSLGASTNGAVFGGQVGYNWQAANTVFGLEGDFDGSGISGTKSINYPSILIGVLTNSFTATEKVDWLASIRGRLGYTTGPTLFYITGGVAWEGINSASTTVSETAPGVFGAVANGNGTRTNTGWTLGGGVERMIAQNWTVRGEYLYYGFNQNNSQTVAFSSCAVAGCGVTVTGNSNNISVLRAGVNYKF
jgi:outer membrane immunogenic protein